MLQKMRENAQSWIAKVIVGVIVLIFALTGWESISSFNSNAQNAAAVNDAEITRTELDQAVAMQRRQLIQQMQQLNDSFDPGMINDNLLRESVLEDLIDRAVLLDGAQAADLRVSEQMIDQLILSTPDFQVDGQFDANRFDIVIRNMGLASRLAFRDLVRQELMINQLRSAYVTSAFATPTERLQLARLEEQSRDFATIELDVDNDAVTIGEDEVSDYYTANAEQFMTEEQVVLEVLTLSRSDFFDQVEVDETELQAMYEQEIGNLEEQRRVSHILIEVAEGDAEADAAALEQAQAISERLEQGEDFADIAEELSDDTGSASGGGDLGYAVRGSYDPAFEEALFNLEEGQVSEPVRTSFGYHLVKLTGLLAPEVPSLESMRPEIERELKAEQVERRFVEASRELANLAYESEDLSEPARALDLEVETIGPVGRQGDEGLTANPRVMAAAFNEEVLADGLNSELLELDADTAVVLRVKEHLRATQRPLEEVRDEIVDTLRFERAVEQAESKAAEYVAALREGDLEAAALAEQLGQSWETHEAIRRSSNDLPAALLRNVFAMPRPDAEGAVYGHFRQPDGSQWIVQLNGVATPQSLEEAVDGDMYQSFISGQAGQQDFSALQQRLKEQADIERF
ncbi:MAG: SurA N-terminal domain-containing protein [Pseudomonas sp.]|nr:SurA N-terminal domain-containing protein [Pseudomonas sp.]